MSYAIMYMTTNKKLAILESWCRDTLKGTTADGEHYLLIHTIKDNGLRCCGLMDKDWDKVVDTAYDTVWWTIADHIYIPRGENSM